MPIDLVRQASQGATKPEEKGKDLLHAVVNKPRDLVAIADEVKNPKYNYQISLEGNDDDGVSWNDKRDAVFAPWLRGGLDIALGNKIGTTTKVLDENKNLIDVPLQAAVGVVSGATFALPQLLASDWIPNYPGKETWKRTLQPDTVAGELTNRMASIYGLWNAISNLNRLPVFQVFDKMKATTKTAKFVRGMLSSGWKLGAYSALSQHGGESVQENLIGRAKSGAWGAAYGMAFAAISNFSGELVQRGFNKGGVVPLTAKGAAKLRISDLHSQLTAFAVRLGANSLIMAGPTAYKMVKEGAKGSWIDLSYELGLSALFSVAQNPLTAERDFNRSVKQRHNLKVVSPESINKHVYKYNSSAEVPADVKWAYIMKVTDGKVKPTYQNGGDYLKNIELQRTNPSKYNELLGNGQVGSNIGSTDAIFRQLLRENDPETAKKFDYLDKFKRDAEDAFEIMLGDKPTQEHIEAYVTTLPTTTPTDKPTSRTEVGELATDIIIGNKPMPKVKLTLEERKQRKKASKRATKLNIKQGNAFKFLLDNYGVPVNEFANPDNAEAMRKLLNKYPNANAEQLAKLFYDRVLVIRRDLESAEQMMPAALELRDTARTMGFEWNQKTNEILEYVNAKWYEQQGTMTEDMFRKWLVNDDGYKLTLDGYNEELGIAFEYQGSLHIQQMFYDTPTTFARRQKNDKIKKRLCAANNVILLCPDRTLKPEEHEKFIRKNLSKKAKILV